MIDRELIEPGVHLGEQGSLLGARVGTRDVFIVAVGLGPEPGAELTHPELSARDADRDRGEPPAKGGRVAQTLDPASGLEEDVLHQVVELLVTAEQAHPHGGYVGRIPPEGRVQVDGRGRGGRERERGAWRSGWRRRCHGRRFL